MKDIPFTIRDPQSREKVRWALGEPVQLLEVEREGIVGWQRLSRIRAKEPAKIVVVFLLGLN